MMKKRKYISIGLLIAFGTFLGIGASINAGNSEGYENNIEQEYSEVLADVDTDTVDYEKMYSEDGKVEEIVEALEENEISEVGENIVITAEEVEQYEEYFELAGTDNPKQEAIDYAEERNALYVAAIENGFAVTDEEVYAYLEELKSMLKQEENAEMYAEIISEFESEEAYWDFEFEVYKVNLPIQNYVASLESQYQEETGIENQQEFDEAWSEEYEEIKEDLVEEQSFVSVDDIEN